MENGVGFVLKDITRSYDGKKVVDAVSCQIEPGIRWGILGASGSGKSTFLRLLAGIESPDHGEIFLDRRLLSRGRVIKVPARKRRISMVFQDLALWPNLTVMENVTLGLERSAAFRKRAMESLSMCGISELANRYPSQLSGGEQQRLALARALATRPEYLLLDEPFSGLDIEIKNSIMDRIKVLTDAHDITTILVSHDPFEVSSLCDRIILMCEGRIVETGNFSTLLHESRFPLLKAFKDYLARLEFSDDRNDAFRRH